jgi:hypothetical protein
LLSKEEKEALSSDTILDTSECILQARKNELERLTKVIEKLEALKEQAGVLYADFEGTVADFNLTKYAVTTGEERILVASKECYVMCKFPCELEGYIQEGDIITCEIIGETTPAEAEISEIYLDESGLEGCLEAELMDKGRYTIGAGVAFRYTEFDITCDNCINVMALHKDMDGYYVLIPQETSSILGNEMKAYRVNVELEKKDSKTAIIKGSISNGDNVIISSNKVITNGSTIRLID